MNKRRLLMQTMLLLLCVTLLAMAPGAGCLREDDASDAEPATDDDTTPAADDDTTPIDDDEDDVVPPAGGCPRAVVTSGLGLAWAKVNHRISLWRVAPEQVSCPATVPDDVTLQVGSVGGNWSTGQTMSDTPSVAYAYNAVDGGDNAAFYPVAVSLWLDAPADEAEIDVDVSLADAQLDGYAHHAVLLNGLELRTDVEQVDPDYPDNYDPALGYTSRGIGAAVRDLQVADGVARFVAHARFDLGPADRRKMNRAIEHARTKAVVHALLIGYNEGNVAAAEHGYSVSYDHRLLLQPDYPHAPEELRQLTITGAPGYPVAFAGLQSFDFRLFASVEEGDYIREFSVMASLLDYDETTGEALIDLDGYASNAGWLTYEDLENDFTATIALVQWPSGQATAGEKFVEFDTGEQEMTLP